MKKISIKSRRFFAFFCSFVLSFMIIFIILFFRNSIYASEGMSAYIKGPEGIFINSDFDITHLEELIEKANNTSGLDLSIDSKSEEMKESDFVEAQSTFVEENNFIIKKLEEVIAAQEEANRLYAMERNDSDKLLISHREGFDKNRIIDFLTRDNLFDYAAVNDLDLRKSKAIITDAKRVDKAEADALIARYVSGQHIEVFENYSKLSGQDGGVFDIKVGDTFIFKGPFKDKRTGKEIDVKFTIKSLESTGINGINLVGLRLGDGWTSFADLKSVDWKVEYFEAGTNNPIQLDILYNAKDIDERQEIEVKGAKKILLSTNSSIIINAEAARGSKMVDNDDVDGWALFIDREVSEQDISWRTVENKKFYWAHIDFANSNMAFNEPILKTSSFKIVKHIITTCLDKQRARIEYIDEDTKELLLKDEIEGLSREAFNYNYEDKVKKFEEKGYTLSSSNFPGEVSEQVFDSDAKVDQVYKVFLARKSNEDTNKRTNSYEEKWGKKNKSDEGDTVVLKEATRVKSEAANTGDVNLKNLFALIASIAIGLVVATFLLLSKKKSADKKNN